MSQSGPCKPGRRPSAALNPTVAICPVCPHAVIIHDETGCYGCGATEEGNN